MKKITEADLRWMGYEHDGDSWISPYTGAAMTFEQAQQVEWDRQLENLAKLNE